MKRKQLIFLMLLIGLIPCCAHLGDTCDTYCVRHGGQCAGVDYGTRRYNTSTGDYKEKPTYFNCRFIN
jgi:hypothetical protein